MQGKPTVLEVCAGAGGQALGLEQAGFQSVALVDIDKHCVETLLLNRPEWRVCQEDINHFDGHPYYGVDLIAAGIPCPPFSIAGERLGEDDERNLFPAMIRLIEEIRPKAVMIENVPGLMGKMFEDYRTRISSKFVTLGYRPGWSLLNACDFGVPQLRPRTVLVAVMAELAEHFYWPRPDGHKPLTVGETLRDLMGSRGWLRVDDWCRGASAVAPTIVGGSLKHGGPDLGPTRARQAWVALGVDGRGIADDPPAPNFDRFPRLTVRMAARLQGFPDTWHIAGGKTASYRQVGNAFPPQVARAVGERIKVCLVPSK